MVRRSTVDRSPQPAVHAAGYDAGTRDLAQGGGVTQRRGGQPWRGAGGRWLVWVFRVVVWLVLLVIGYRGITAIVLNETPSSGSAPVRPAPGAGFPVLAAEAYAWQFGQVYLNASPSTASQRAAELAQFLPSGSDPQAGWDGSGTLQLQSEQVAGVRVRDAHHAVVTLLARVNGQLMGLGVPVYAAQDGMTVTGEPALLPAPTRIAVPSSAPVNTDSATTAALMKQLPAFFEAYASGSQVTLGRFEVPGAKVTGLGGAVKFGELTSVTVLPGGNQRDITATVTWRVSSPSSAGTAGKQSPAQLEMTYALTILKQHGTWYVKSISPSTQTGGSS
jgi:hypothetical protein